MNIPEYNRQGSLISVNVTIGFLYWLQERHDIHGLRDLAITSFPKKVEQLLKEYNTKYPNGLTGWS